MQRNWLQEVDRARKGTFVGSPHAAGNTLARPPLPPAVSRAGEAGASAVVRGRLENVRVAENTAPGSRDAKKPCACVRILRVAVSVRVRFTVCLLLSPCRANAYGHGGIKLKRSTFRKQSHGGNECKTRRYMPESAPGLERDMQAEDPTPTPHTYASRRWRKKLSKHKIDPVILIAAQSGLFVSFRAQIPGMQLAFIQVPILNCDNSCGTSSNGPLHRR